jgi:hypothetical protein
VKWKHDDGYGEWWVIPQEVETLIQLGVKALRKYLSETPTALTLKTKEGIMSNYQLNAGDSVVVTVAATNTAGTVVATDSGSVKAVLSSSTDTVKVDSSGLFLTLTAGTDAGTSRTVTVNATVNGVACTAAVGTYDVVASTTSATALKLSFGTEVTATQEAAKVYGNAVGEYSATTGLLNT